MDWSQYTSTSEAEFTVNTQLETSPKDIYVVIKACKSCKWQCTAVNSKKETSWQNL